MNIIDFIDSDILTPGSFEGESWNTWRAVLSATFGLGLDKKQQEIFNSLSGGRKCPVRRVRELWVVAGRRSAKTHVSATVGAYLATIGAEIEGIIDNLSPGERGVVSILAVDRKQAAVAFNYVKGIFNASPTLSNMVVKQLAESIELSNGLSIEVHTNSYKAVRGRTLIACILDESAFYMDVDSANPDIEIYRAVLPSLATTGGILIGVSSPYAKRGLLYKKFRKNFGKDGDVLVVQGSTRDFNPTISEEIIQDSELDDPLAARAEWGGQFRDDVEGFLSQEVVEAAQRSGPKEFPFDRDRSYYAFADPAGGGQDEFTIAIGHQYGGRGIVDVLRARKGKPADIVGEYAVLLKQYQIYRVKMDRYAGSWPSDEFARHGITCLPIKKNKSELYVDVLAGFNSNRIELPPDDRIVPQFVQLERRTVRGGRGSIDHPPGGHDDRANAVAGLMSMIIAPKQRWGVVDSEDEEQFIAA